MPPDPDQDRDRQGPQLLRCSRCRRIEPCSAAESLNYAIFGVPLCCGMPMDVVAKNGPGPEDTAVDQGRP